VHVGGGGVNMCGKKMQKWKKFGGVYVYCGKKMQNWKKFAGGAEMLLCKFFQLMFRKFFPDPPPVS